MHWIFSIKVLFLVISTIGSHIVAWNLPKDVSQVSWIKHILLVKLLRTENGPQKCRLRKMNWIYHRGTVDRSAYHGCFSKRLKLQEKYWVWMLTSTFLFQRWQKDSRRSWIWIFLLFDIFDIGGKSQFLQNSIVNIQLKKLDLYSKIEL